MLKTINVTFLTFYCSLIFWLSSKPVLATPQLFPHQDKFHHMVAYFIMGILAWRFFKDYINNSRIVLFISFSFCSLYGVSDEWHQSFVADRQADYLDWLADTLGSFIALICILFIKKTK